ncbi:MAG: stage III sporulation protein AB [Clostridia bacterium]|nr:stage III sporulation protein AB [Clostridia bacterium]
MVYKYFAFGIIMLVSMYCAYCFKKYGEDKIKYHYSIIEFISYVKRQIGYFCTPTQKILGNYDDPILNKSGFFEKNGIEENIYLDSQGKKILLEFFSMLGKSDAEDQMANCDYTIESINSLLNEYKDDVVKRYKAYSTISVVVGLMLIILLI